MQTLTPEPIYKEVTTKHNTLDWLGDHGRISLRKRAGRFYVTVEDFFYAKTTTQSYATQKGALVAVETLKAYFI